MFGEIGSTWEDNFYMGAQNGSKYDEIILIHTLELKLRPFEVSPYACIGKLCNCNDFCPRAM